MVRIANTAGHSATPMKTPSRGRNGIVKSEKTPPLKTSHLDKTNRCQPKLRIEKARKRKIKLILRQKIWKICRKREHKFIKLISKVRALIWWIRKTRRSRPPETKVRNKRSGPRSLTRPARTTTKKKFIDRKHSRKSSQGRSRLRTSVKRAIKMSKLITP